MVWNKIKLRGGSRGKAGEERLAYFNGGFVALADAIAAKIEFLGGRIELGAKVSALRPRAEGGCGGRRRSGRVFRRAGGRRPRLRPLSPT